MLFVHYVIILNVYFRQYFPMNRIFYFIQKIIIRLSNIQDQVQDHKQDLCNQLDSLIHHHISKKDFFFMNMNEEI